MAQPPHRPSPHRLARRVVATLVVLALALATPGPTARAASPDAASARGLDVLVAGATSAAPGATLDVALQVVGYRTVLDAAPIEGATVELSWDPAQLKVAPPAVRLETDAGGRASGQVVMPRTGEDARLLVTARHGGRTRTRTITVGRQEPVEIDVIAPETFVVPGTRIGAWVRVRDRALGRRLGGVPIVAEMLDGGVSRERVRAVTDATGSALVFVHVPRVADGAGVSWSLRASLEDGSGAQSVGLAPREETPAQPDLDVVWDGPTVDPGAIAGATIRLRDASREPLVGAAIEWTVTTLHPEDETVDDWEAAREGRTDHEGRLHVRWTAPTAVAGAGLGVRIAARVTVAERTLERSAVVQVRPRGGASFVAQPEAGPLVPGIPQRVLLRVRGDDGKPVSGPARATGDGLGADVVLDAAGEAEITWTPPRDVGSRRDVGPCARSVAATITVEERSGRLARSGGRAFACVTVDRQREALLHVEPTVARAGERIQVRVVPRTPGSAARPTVIVLAPQDRDMGTARAVWIPDGEAGASVELPPGPAGAWSIGAHTPRPGAPALAATGAVLVAPRMVPRIAARVVGGRIAAGGEVEIEARLTDDAGRPVDGLVAGMLFDAFGGAGSDELLRLDSRVALCEAAAIDRARCEDAWRGDAAAGALVRGGLATLRDGAGRVDPVVDPGRTAKPELEAAFAATLKSLEGAVFEASSSPERLIDARRDGARGRTFNPELFRIVTASLATPPTTPGGEPIELADLVAIDPQVRFDVVARRVTRLKLFRVLQRVRDHRHARDLDLDEPVLADPDALLARLTTAGDLEASALLDPWGGTLTFRRARGGGGAPSIASLPGWELASPGPDGRPGTGDDVADPFARVVTSGSPYARALDEDAVVLARSDVRVAAETVHAWSALLERSTGTSLGNVAHGEGHGRLGGSHRTKPPSVRMGATMVDRRAREPAWELPSRTVNGVVRLRLPLGSLDTTYRVVVVGLADGGDPAVTLVDVPVATPIAAQVETGTRWIEGDELEVPIRVRNRTAAPVRLAAHVVARGAASLVAGEPPSRPIEVPGRGTAVVHARIRAARAGEGVIEVTLRDAAQRTVDAVRATVPIERQGRRVTLSRSRWVDGEQTIPLLAPGAGERALGPTRLVVESGVDEAVASALRALDPDVLVTRDALVDAIETGTRVRLHAVEHGDDDLARRASALVERARGRLQGQALDPRSAEVRRAHLFVEVRGHEPAGPPCDADAPAEGGTAARSRDVAEDVARSIALLEAEPAGQQGSSASCWEALATDTADAVGRRSDPVEMARLVLAFAERTHRREETRILAVRLARLVALTAAGHVALPAPHGERREARAVVLAALLRAATEGARLPAPREALRGWLLVQRDGSGAFGASTATRSAVAALLADLPRGAAAGRALEVTELDDDGDPLAPGRRLRIGGPPAGSSMVLAPAAHEVRVVGRGGALVRLEREVLRAASPSAELLESPLRVTVEWPARPRAGGEGVLRVAVRSLRAADGQAQVHVPLPAGVSLAEPVEGVRAIPGALLVATRAQSTDEPLPARIPVRFALAGQLAVPEATARLAEEAGSAAYAPPRRLVVRR